MASLFTVTAAAVASVGGPAAALYYGKDGKRSIQTAFAVGGLLSVAWALIIYSMIWAPSLPGNIIGTALYGTINNAATIPVYANVVFELMFASVFANLVASAVQHRFKPLYLTLLTVVLVMGVYAPIAHWVWGPAGWLGLAGFGAVDYAGGAIIYIAAGVTALVLGVISGVKKAEETTPSSFKLLSVLALVLASFFLNAGKGLGVDGMPGLALVNTQVAAFSGVVSYAFLQWLLPTAEGAKYGEGQATIEGGAKGALVGLTVVASGAGFILPMWEVLMVLIANTFVFLAERKFANVLSAGLEVFLIHGFGGMVGVALTGLFAQGQTIFPTSVYPNGSFFYNAPLLGNQCALISVTVLLAGVATWAVTKVFIEFARVVSQTSILADEVAYTAVPKADAAAEQA